MKGASVEKVILRFYSGNDAICHSQKFQPSQTPPSHFLPISPRFLTNITCWYFSLNIWVVYQQLELDWCIFDQNWAKTRLLHFQIFQILNTTDRRIVQLFALSIFFNSMLSLFVHFYSYYIALNHLVKLALHLETSGQFWNHPENWQLSGKIRTFLQLSGKLTIIWKNPDRFESFGTV